jgi:CxxC motif-containing protein (DUF1111 family)
MMTSRGWVAALTVALGGCGPASTQKPVTVVTDQAVDAPLRHATDADLERFTEGDALFDLTFRPTDGLGPLYIRTKCASCHENGANGPGGVQKMVMVRSDGTFDSDQSALAWGPTVRPYSAAGATPITPPAANVKVTLRLGPPVYGRGYIEAVSDDEILRVAAEQAARNDGISGRPNRVTYASQTNTETAFPRHTPGQTGLIGRFGLKARVATLDDFTADAFQGDMGMTTPMRPSEPANPDGLADDSRSGVDLDLATVNAVADYVRLLEIPTRAEAQPAARALFDQVACSGCHTPALHTRSDWPIAALADIDAPVFTDLLLHDMGAALADGQKDQSAESGEWKTAPLIGLRFMRAYLHDGRAETVRDAVLMHRSEGSEANRSVEAFLALSEAEQQQLVQFVESL